jgi:hypothetical protein
MQTALHDDASPGLEVPVSAVDPPESDPLDDPPSSPEGPGVLLLLQAKSPTVDEAPTTTTAWKSFSTFIKGNVAPEGNDRNPSNDRATYPGWNARASSTARVEKTSAPSFRYLPRPAQQGSASQIGLVANAGLDVPAGNQQQHPLQFVQLESCGSGLHTALHDDASLPGFEFPASVDAPESVEARTPLSPLEAPPLLLLLRAIVQL